MVGLDVLNQPRNSAVVAPGKMRGPNSTGNLEKCGNLAATPTTAATHQHPSIGRVARPTAIPDYLSAETARLYSRRDNFQEDY